MKKNTFTHRLAKILVDVLLCLCIAAVPTVPWWAKAIFDRTWYTETEWYAFVATLILTGACTVYILTVVKGMFKTLLGDDPFVRENVSAFRKIAVACALISLAYAAKCIFSCTFATVVITLIFALSALFCLVLKDIFKQAVYYKEENDWTV